MKILTLKILGMDCASCASTITKRLEKNPNIIKAPINLALEMAKISYDEKKINEKEIKKIIISTGYQITEDQKENHSHHKHKQSKLQVIKLSLSILLLLHS